MSQMPRMLQMSPHPVAIMWFRNDLRLADNPALIAACQWVGANGGAVLPIFILDDVMERQLGGATRWWLEQSLMALDASLARHLPGASSSGSQQQNAKALRLYRGDAAAILAHLANPGEQGGPHAVFWNRLYDRASIARDSAIKSMLRDQGTPCDSFNGHLLFEPWEIRTGTGTDFKVFTPFWRACQKAPPPASAQKSPDHIPLLPAATATPAEQIETRANSNDAIDRQCDLADLALSPRPVNWAGGLAERFTPGEQGALDQLIGFLDDRLIDYADQRDRPDRRVTSELSPHLRFGEISPRQIWQAIAHHSDAHPERGKTAAKFTSELGWREFAHHVLFHAPDLRSKPLQPQFAAFPWQADENALQRWQQGQTGFPIVDAGMRELWHSGYMHNRVRMIAGSILVKHLLIDWRDGLAWFDDTLVDACPAANPFSWQWIGGCGADAAPYFRIFNPVLQGEKFDPDGHYIRQWVPELRNLPDRFIHKPWEAPPLILQGANITLGRDYPEPVIGVSQGRERALAAYQTMKATNA